ncbi:RecQ-mediated genome instability protein 1 [Exaiptasia diaphana]|nr:RecQ-mediated genome instability protein 1 [Exaiptasia diaphana]
MADFQEMSLGSLPNVSGQLMVTLQGKHTLQMNSILDVGQSAYSQIQKMKGKDDPETLRENSANKDTWEKKVKPSRMLYLQLNDGSQSIQAMEYQLIPSLRLDIPPGTKVQIQGPVDCRLGVLLLTAKNIHILGGTIDELVETNCLWNMLHNAIGKEPPPQPAGVKVQEALSHQEPATASNNYESNEPINNVQNTRNSVQTDNYNKITSRKNTRPSNNHGNFTSKQPQSSIQLKMENEDFEQFEVENDYFDDVGDENFDFDQLDQMEQDVALSEPDDFEEKEAHDVEQFDDGMFGDADELMDDDLEDFDLDTSKSTQNLKTPTAVSNKSNIQSKIDIKRPNIHLSSGTNSNSAKQVKSQPNHEQKSFSIMMGSSAINININAAGNTLPHQAELNKLQRRTMSLRSQLGTAVDEQVSAALAAADAAVASATNSINNTLININFDKPSVKTGKNRATVITKPANKHKSASILSHLVPRTKEAEENITQHKKIKIETNTGASYLDQEPSRPYQYLSTVIRNLPGKEDKTIRIKGYISTLISHSQVSDLNQQWRVTVKINDGTASIDADLGEQVLTELLDCPLALFQRQMVEAKKSRDPLKCRALQQKTVLFQQKLSMISCLMDLHFSMSQPRPVVTGLFEANDKDIQSLLQSFK